MAERTWDIISLGRLAIDLYADEVGVELAEVGHFRAYAGGCPTNVAVGAARLGLRVAMVSRIGADALSNGLMQFLAQEEIDTRYVVRDPEHLTGLAFLGILPPDTFPLVYYRPDPADIHLTTGDIAPIPFDAARILFVAGTRFSAEPAGTTALVAMERASAAGTEVVLDVDKRPTLWTDLSTFGARIRSALPLVDIVIGTEDEITAAADRPSVESAVPVLLERVRKAVAVKRGQSGSEIHTRDGAVYHASPFPVEVLNVLGAGDAWAAGFMTGYLSGWTWERCARFGNATGAIIVTRHACANDMPTREEVLAFIEARGGFG